MAAILKLARRPVAVVLVWKRMESNFFGLSVNWYIRVMESMQKEMGRRFLTGLRNFIQV